MEDNHRHVGLELTLGYRSVETIQEPRGRRRTSDRGKQRTLRMAARHSCHTEGGEGLPVEDQYRTRSREPKMHHQRRQFQKQELLEGIDGNNSAFSYDEVL